MQLSVRFFASLAERTGCASEPVTLETGADVGRLWQLLVERHPGLARIGFRPLVACDQVYSGWDRVLDGVAEVAFLPPVSGG